MKIGFRSRFLKDGTSFVFACLYVGRKVTLVDTFVLLVGFIVGDMVSVRFPSKRGCLVIDVAIFLFP